MHSFMFDKKFQDMEVETRDQHYGASSHSWLQEILSGCKVSGSLELFDVSIRLRISSSEGTACIGCNHIRLGLDQVFNLQGIENHCVMHILKVPQNSSFFTYFVPFIGPGSASPLEDWSGELLVEALWCHLGMSRDDSDVYIYQRKRCHVWGTSLFLGVMLLSTRGHAGVLYPHKLEGMLNMLCGEWSPQLAAFISHAMR